MHIRPFETDDAKELSELIINTLFKINITDYSPETLSEVASMYTESSLVDHSKKRTILIAKDGQKIIGTGSLENDAICGVFASHERQTQGIGRQIMNQLELIAKEKGIKTIKLSASLTASRFYEKLGYHPIGKKETLYGINIIMIKEL